MIIYYNKLFTFNVVKSQVLKFLKEKPSPLLMDLFKFLDEDTKDDEWFDYYYCSFSPTITRTISISLQYYTPIYILPYYCIVHFLYSLSLSPIPFFSISFLTSSTLCFGTLISSRDFSQFINAVAHFCMWARKELLKYW